MDNILNDKSVRDFLFELTMNIRIPGGGWMVTTRWAGPDGEDIFDCDPVAYFQSDMYVLDDKGFSGVVGEGLALCDYHVWHPSQVRGTFRMNHEKAITIIKAARREANQSTDAATPPDIVS